ncbi:MAG: hypothetical protein U1F45_18525 [Burkholderiales bacterium]
MRVDRPATATPLRWGRVLAWIAAWALVVAAGYWAPLWVAVALAIGVFGAQVLLAPGCAPACRAPERGAGASAHVTEDTRSSAR